MALSAGGDFEIKLQIRYFGLKATQYFSKFTPESDATFRGDLTSLKLPHPKRENTTFVSHGYPQKRKLPEEYTQSYPSKSTSSQPVNHSSNGLPFPFKKHNTTWERPHKLFKIDPADDPSRSPEPEQPFPTFKNLPPLPPRKAPEKIHVPIPSNSKGPRTSDTSHTTTQNAENKKGEEDINVRSQSSSQSLRPTTNGNKPTTSSSINSKKKPSTIGKHITSSFRNSFGLQNTPNINQSQISTAKPTLPISKPFDFNFKPSTQVGQVSSIFPGTETDTTKVTPKVPSASTGQTVQTGTSFRTNMSGGHPTSFSEKNNGRRNEGTSSGAFGGKNASISQNQASPSFADIFGSQKPPDGTQKAVTMFTYTYSSDSSQTTSYDPGTSNFKAPRNVATSSQSQTGIADLNPSSSGIAAVQTVFTNPFDTTRSPVTTYDVKMDVDSVHNASKAPPVAPKAYYSQINTEASSSWYKPQSRSRLPTEPILQGRYTKPDKTPESPPVKQECTEDTTVLHTFHAPNLSVTSTDGNTQTRIRPSRFQPAESSTNEKDAQQDKNKGSNLVKEFLSSLKSKESERARAQQASDNSSTEQTLLKVEAPEPQIPSSSSSQLVHQTQPPSPVALDQYERGSMQQQQQQWGWYDSSEVPPFRGPAPQVDTTTGFVLPTPPPSAIDPVSTALAAFNTLKWASWYHNPEQQQQHQQPPVEPFITSDFPIPSESTGPLAPSLSSSSSLFQSASSLSSSSTTSPKTHKRKRPSTHTKDELLAIQTLLRESSDIKREIAAKMAREAVVIAELKSLNSSVVPRPIMLGHQTEEAEMEAEIFRLRNELKREKRLREEAENAIKDIRRECKEPFVVPSLLDAFVQVSKLTTRGLRPPDAPQIDAKAK
ncbi:hypothetical protein JR316_0011630 [Psilocybe cubensis]|uniref:Uncharacterized protein n=1 Tax=Psilocybe cubensis TaxID=181762 RepID=A0ACB8GM07_PSICU|nr:hypothetical protein JR316_0011630 [Psilocybe cubensis]KAH9476060.1 hypothetical protein JR316_0011630 [Psilocybe cubensis]